MSTCLLLSSHFETLYCIGFGNSSEPRRFWLNISDLLDVCDEQYVMILTYGCAAVTASELRAGVRLSWVLTTDWLHANDGERRKKYIASYITAKHVILCVPRHLRQVKYILAVAKSFTFYALKEAQKRQYKL
eukprot:6198151-Pleurochrysis_carterae.AAC.1